LRLGLEPAFAALEHAALGDPPVEWEGPAAARGRAHRVAPLRIPPFHPRTPIAVTAFGAAWHHQFAHNHHSFLHDHHSFSYD
jgi:hypothetical protein